MATILGGSGSDTLTGIAGDILSGGSGSDTYVIDAPGVIVAEASGGSSPSGAITLISASADGSVGISPSYSPSFSPDGAKVVFESYADNLVPGDVNGMADIFVKDLVSGSISLVSTAADGSQGNWTSYSPSFSPDGAKVAFASYADNLVPGDLNGVTDIFLKDLASGSISLATTAADGSQGNNSASKVQNGTYAASFSPDGTEVVFASYADNLVPGDSNGDQDIFVKDLASGSISLVSNALDGSQGNDYSFHPAFSPDGSKVSFASYADNLVPGDSNFSPDVFVKDLASGSISLVSAAADGSPGNLGSSGSSFSRDGSKVVFVSTADNLVPGDVNGTSDIFVKDLVSGSISLVSTAADGSPGDYDSFHGSFSPDGAKVVFASGADNLVPGDVNGTYDVFVKDLASGGISVVSTAADGSSADFFSFQPSFSPDGAKVVFYSYATNLVPGDTNGSSDIFVKEISTPGIDIVKASVSYTLPDNVEDLTLTGSAAIDGAGNALDNLITGNAGDNRLTGGTGDDTLWGKAGFDTAVFAGNRSDYVIRREGTWVYGGWHTVGGPDGMDWVAGVERLQFDDGAMLLRPTANDFDGDGKSDILWRNTTTGVDVAWKSASSATVLAVKTRADQNWQVAGLGDFDGDGKCDILWRNLSTGGNNIWKGANSLTAQATAAFTDLNWKVAGVGDFNGDGKSDILWRNGATATNKIWLSANAATIQNVAKTATLDWQVAGLGDFDGDGKSDILWRNGATGANLIWKGGSSAATLRLTAQADLKWKVAGIGDFDGDGQSDILWRHAGTGANKIWKSGSGANVQAVTTAGVGWQVLGTGDYDGDGKSDILWRNTSTTTCNIWKAANSTTTQAVSAQSLDNAAADGLATGDLLLGGTGNNRLIGTLASDSLSGGAGNDTISGGGGGKDTMVGGAGNDTFVIDRVAQLTAAITDFVSGQDKLGLAQSAYGDLFASGSLTAGVFASDATDAFATAEQRLQYNSATGGLWYDADGTGTAVAVQIATLGVSGSRPSLAAGDFLAAAG